MPDQKSQPIATKMKKKQNILFCPDTSNIRKSLFPIINAAVMITKKTVEVYHKTQRINSTKKKKKYYRLQKP